MTRLPTFSVEFARCVLVLAAGAATCGASPFSDEPPGGPAGETIEIAAGIDIFTTPAAETSYIDFFEAPLPAGFFGPGSDPFYGLVWLGGQPLATEPPGVFGQTDAIIERLAPGLLPGPLSEAVVPIELVALSLVSVNPITVTYNGGQNPQAWRVNVSLSRQPQPQGVMRIRRGECGNDQGGTFVDQLPLLPRLTFRRVSQPSQVRELDFGIAGRPPLMLETLFGHWNAAPVLPVQHAPPGVWVDHDADSRTPLRGPLPGGSNFFPGIRSDRCVFEDCAFPPRFSKRMTMRANSGVLHGTHLTQPPGPDGDLDRIPDDVDNCPIAANPRQEDFDDDGVGGVCDNCGTRNACQEDEDNDGVGDPCEAACGGLAPGDCNCDGAVNNFDIDPFVLALSDPAGYAGQYPGCDRLCTADMDGDGLVTNFDIDPFVECVASGGCMPNPKRCRYRINCVTLVEWCPNETARNLLVPAGSSAYVCTEIVCDRTPDCYEHQTRNCTGAYIRIPCPLPGNPRNEGVAAVRLQREDCNDCQGGDWRPAENPFAASRDCNGVACP